MGSACLEARPGTIPAAGICYEDAMLVSAKAGHATVEIAGTSSIGDAVSSNGIGLLRGESDEEIVVCGHIDSWFSVGAVDNGSGVASVVELARLLCRYPLQRTVRFVSLGSEEVGLLGSQAFVAAHADISRVALVVNLDCPTLKDPRLTVFTNETPALHSFMEEIVKALHVDVELSTGMSRYSDHVSSALGVAGVHLLAGSTTSGFGHTEYDSLDKIRPENFTIPLLVAGDDDPGMRHARRPFPAAGLTGIVSTEVIFTAAPSGRRPAASPRARRDSAAAARDPRRGRPSSRASRRAGSRLRRSAGGDSG